MNSTRRNQLKDIQQQLEDIASRLETLKKEEYKEYDNMSESLKDSQFGEKAKVTCCALGSVHLRVQSAHDVIDEIFEL